MTRSFERTSEQPLEWLSLSAAAKLLGVHPSTIRNWSDHGLLPVHRTQGGHRRFLRSEVELWRLSRQVDAGPADFNLVVQNALRNTRMQIAEGRLKDEAWYRKLDEEARDQYRRSGRSLLQGLITYLNEEDRVGIAEAHALGYEYAARGRRYGLSVVEATHAFLFFRSMLMDSMLTVFESAAVSSPYAWSHMFRKVTEFTDYIALSLLETFSAYQGPKSNP